jgi:PAS domain S-box-containing protein
MKNFFTDPGFLVSILETMADGLMVVDPEGRILYLNPAAERMTGYSVKEVLGRPCSMLDTDACVFTPDGGGSHGCRLFQLGSVSGKRCTIRGKKGSTVHLLKNAVVLKNRQGQVVGAVEVMTDVTSLYMKELEVEELKNELCQEYGYMGILGTSPIMMSLCEQIRNAAASEAPVLITGESGTGKELVAHAIHRLSKRHKGPFVKVNCAALNEHLLESELFGHVRGAFTGAIRDRQGRFEAAHNGTLFLDEIGDMPPSMQVKLLRVLQEKEIERVGDHRPLRVNVRLITATNRDFSEVVASGRIREDFSYRVNVIPIRTPPLREKMEDLPILAGHLMKRISIVNQKPTLRIAPAALEAMKAYEWPGNVRQLINALEYAAVTCHDGTIELADLPAYIAQAAKSAEAGRKNYRRRENLLAALERSRWNRSLAARHLGISRVTLWKLMKEMSIAEPPSS